MLHIISTVQRENCTGNLMEEALQKKKGISIVGEFRTIKCADDQVVIAELEEQLQGVMNKTSGIENEFGMKINTEKTKIMQIGGNGEMKATLTLQRTDKHWKLSNLLDTLEVW